ncbi:MAG: endonuclease IV, partial [Christensenellales bacterium]
IYARRLGQFGDKKSFAAILDGIESSLGKERAKQIHVHFSRIEFTKGGEKRHWNYQDIQYGPNFDPLAALLAQRDYTAVVICESSGKMAEDAATYRDMYLKAREAWQHESKM